jgi:hypothetical protein
MSAEWLQYFLNRSKEKGQFMIMQLLKRKIASEKQIAHFCQIVCSLVAALVLIFGFLRLPALELTEAQLFSACVQTLVLAGVFIILGFQSRAWRRSA